MFHDDHLYDEMRRGYPRPRARGRKRRAPFRLDETEKEWMVMQTAITAKLKLVTTPEQFRQLRLTQLAYRDALNQASLHAFAHGKTSNSQRLHHDLYFYYRSCYDTVLLVSGSSKDRGAFAN